MTKRALIRTLNDPHDHNTNHKRLWGRVKINLKMVVGGIWTWYLNDLNASLSHLLHRAFGSYGIHNDKAPSVSDFGQPLEWRHYSDL